jgi:uncharacterized integral membrane protein (TIGR00698 family)
MPVFIDAPRALLLGIMTAMLMGHPYQHLNKKATTLLLQTSVVLLGLHLDLEHAMQAGGKGFVFTISTIVLTLAAGYLIGKWFKIDSKTSFLISNGTAICGGSAIAAVSPIIKADDHQVSVSLGTIFILNSVALLIFPSIGHWLNMSAEQFGTWCAIAIHDTSSVVGASSGYFDNAHAEALPIATTIKLERALWIIPIALITAYFQKNNGKKLKLPYFIFYFVIAIVVSTYLPNYLPWLKETFSIHAPFATKDQTFFGYLYILGKKGLVVTLFLIGSGLSINAIRQVGYKPVLQGVLLWILIGITSLLVIRQTLP